MSGESAVRSGACPDEGVIAAFAEGALGPAQAQTVEAHLDECEACAHVVAGLARIFADERGPGSGSAQGEYGGLGSDELAITQGSRDAASIERPLGALLPSGAQVGRYRVLECVGVGGMGAVYAAYDPQLDRRVALKLLRDSGSGSGSGGANARLLREAQALARLTHPNVITVHDVGTWKEQVFVAMEYVDGTTLKQWLASSPRTWTSIREVFVAAGRGLAAAHAADLVHRDFKPDNVLIGRDGRVRVTDFGLARWGAASMSAGDLLVTDDALAQKLRRSGSEPISLREPSPEVSLTRTGALVGTPAYMAPEQYAHQPADAASDQFGFCVALYEALYGERPFQGRTLAELSSNVMEGRLPEEPPGHAVPRSVRQAIRRGLSRQRRDRFASMGELLAALEAGSRGSSRVRLGLGALGLGAVLWALAGSGAPDEPACRPERDLSSSWNPERRRAVRESFVATGLAYAESSADRTAAALDEYVADWEELRTQACRASGGVTEGPAVAALRERCLERRRVSLAALVDALAGADESIVSRSVGTVLGLPAVEDCRDREALVAELPPAPPAAMREAVEAMRDRFARLDGLIAAGRYRDGLELARALEAEAAALEHGPLHAEAQFWVAQLLDFSGDGEAAERVFEQAALTAIATRHRRLLARVLVHRVYVLGVVMARIEDARRVARWAEAEIEGAGMREEAMSALLLNRGSVAYREGDYQRAAGHFRDAMNLRDRERDPMGWADAAFNLASMRGLLGEDDAAIAGLRDYLEVFEAQLGRMHPEVAAGYHNLGATYLNAGRYEEALDAMLIAVEVNRTTLGVEHPLHASSLNLKGSILNSLGRPEEGIAPMQQSVEILERLGSDPSRLGMYRVELGRALLAVDRVDEGAAHIVAGREGLEAALGAEHPEIIDGWVALAEVAAIRGDAAGVRRSFERIDALQRKLAEQIESDPVRMRVEEASLLHRAGEREQAREILEEILVSLAGHEPDQTTAAAQMSMANVLWDEPSERPRAVALVRTVVEQQRATGREVLAREAERWLDAHR